MLFHILSVIPGALDSYITQSVLGRAQKNKLITIKSYDIRRWATDKHKKVDDRPFGGGAGMVLKVEPIFKAVASIRAKIAKAKKKTKTRVILFSTRGALFTQEKAQQLSRYDHVILICGRYEGIDERVAKYIADEEISLGDVVYSGGEIPALAVVDAVARKLPGVLGKYESLEEIQGSYPTYTRPEIFIPDVKNKKKKWAVPAVLRSGDHKKIENWRNGNKV